MRGLRNAPIVAAAVVTVALFVGQAEAESVVIGGTFMMNFVSGEPGEDLLPIVGNENSWVIRLENVEFVHSQESCFHLPGESEMYTTLHAASFEFEYFGPDAAILNSEVAGQFAQGGLGGDGYLEVMADNCYGGVLSCFFYIWPDVPSQGVYWSVDAPATPDDFPLDEDGFPIIGPFEVDASQTILFDRRGGNDGNIAALSASTLWLETETAVAPATWSTVKVLYR
jgi:hypothetical protein